MKAGRSGRGAVSAKPREVQPLDDRTSGLPGVAVGDLGVYASYGIGRIESLSRRKGRPETVVLAFGSGLRVTLPIVGAGDVGGFQ
jgi:hypothetical protein